MRVSAIVAAAGQGKRMGAEQNKVYLPLGKEPILAVTLKELEKIDEIVELIVVVQADEVAFCEEKIFAERHFRKPYKVIAGGKERQDSVQAGLAALSHDSDFVLIHDGARPLITEELIKNALTKALASGTAVLAVPVKDTVKIVAPDGVVESTPERAKLRAVQTPQIFHREIIFKAYERAKVTGYYGTDDASLVEALGVAVYLVQGSYENLKITTPEDLLLAEEIIRRRSKCGLE